MYKHKFLFVLFVFSCLLSSCRVSRQEKQSTQSTQTTEKVVSYKDTTVFAPKAETSLKIPMAALGFKNPLNTISKPIYYSQKNGQAKVKLKVVHDTIQVTATCDSLAIVAKIKSEFQKQISDSNSQLEQETLKKRGFSFWIVLLTFCIGFFVGFILKFFKIV